MDEWVEGWMDEWMVREYRWVGDEHHGRAHVKHTENQQKGSMTGRGSVWWRKNRERANMKGCVHHVHT